MAGRPAMAREALLAAAEARIRNDPTKLALADIAAAAGVSRQSVYDIFGSRTALLAALIEYVEAAVPGVGDYQAFVVGAPTALDMLDRFIVHRAMYVPKTFDIVDAMRAIADIDEDMAAIWARYCQSRRDQCSAVAERLHHDALLRSGLTVDHAADSLWSTTAPYVWSMLAERSGWRPEQYLEAVRSMVAKAILTQDIPMSSEIAEAVDRLGAVERRLRKR